MLNFISCKECGNEWHVTNAALERMSGPFICTRCGGHGDISTMSAGSLRLSDVLFRRPSLRHAR